MFTTDTLRGLQKQATACSQRVIQAKHPFSGRCLDAGGAGIEVVGGSNFGSALASVPCDFRFPQSQFTTSLESLMFHCDMDDDGEGGHRKVALGALSHLQNQSANGSGLGTPGSQNDSGFATPEAHGQMDEAERVLRDLELQQQTGKAKEPSSAVNQNSAKAGLVVRRDSLFQRLAVHANLVTFAILGTATRIGLTRLATYEGQTVFPIAVSQAVGCAVMGLVVRNKELLESMCVPFRSVQLSLFLLLIIYSQ